MTDEKRLTLDPNANHYLVAWDMYGLEAVVDLRELEGEELMSLLADEKAGQISNTLRYFIMRARANAQRNYEIHKITTSLEISADDLTKMFNDNPQGAADIIRDSGTLVYPSHSEVSSRKNPIIR